MSFTKPIVTLVACLLALTSYAVQAGGFKTVGDYVIYYNAVNTEVLQPDIAQNYQIVRSKNRALLNISVRKSGTKDEMKDKSVPAKVSATAANLNKQLKTIEMKPVQEGEAMYYIGVFTITDNETLDFTIKVDPESQGKDTEITFRQEFFTN